VQAGGAVGTIVLSLRNVVEFRNVYKPVETIYPYEGHLSSPVAQGSWRRFTVCYLQGLFSERIQNAKRAKKVQILNEPVARQTGLTSEVPN
jgi:hypothetical protein